MKTEFEAKFLRINHDSVRARLKELGATLKQPMRLMKRAIIETPELRAKNAYLRVRDEGNQVTLTYKQFDSLSIDGAKEHEIQVSNFQDTLKLLAAVGLPHHSYQESKRETWKLDHAEIVLDEWPWLDPYIEIEGQGKQHVREVAAKLELNWEDALFGDVMVAYRVQYPHISPEDTVGNIAEVRFGDPLPTFLVHDQFTLRQ